jgi:hypothetical protein
MARETLDIALDTTALVADLTYLADAIKRIQRNELRVPLETRDAAFGLAQELLDRSSRIADSFVIKSEPSAASGAGELLCRVELGSIFDKTLAALRACDFEPSHRGSPC